MMSFCLAKATGSGVFGPHSAPSPQVDYDQLYLTVMSPEYQGTRLPLLLAPEALAGTLSVDLADTYHKFPKLFDEKIEVVAFQYRRGMHTFDPNGALGSDSGPWSKFSTAPARLARDKFVGSLCGSLCCPRVPRRLRGAVPH